MNLASTIRMMAEKKDNPPFDVSKADYAGAAKELTQYAKTKGGMDKDDFLSMANRMASIAKKKSPNVMAKFARDLGALDTSPREKVVSVMRNNGIKVTMGNRGLRIEEHDVEEWEELEETKVQGKEVFDKTFANRTQADNFAKKNGGRVKQVGRVFYVFKEAPEDNEPASPDEGSMAEQQLEFIEYAAERLSDHIKSGGDFPEWMQNKLATVNDNMQSLYSQIDQDGSDQMDEAYKTPAEARAYEDGKKAVAKKVSYDDNPNKKGTKEYTAWSKGHNDARAKMIGNRFSKEEVELEEARDPSKSGGTGYDLYHKDFSSAMKHAYDYAKKNFGIEIDPKEIDDKVASGPRKPSAGKTNSYRLKSKDGKKGVQIQVANLDNKKYELNMYKEEVEMENIEEAEFFKWEVKIGGKSWRGTARNAGEAVKKARPSMGNLDLTKASVTRIKEDIDMSLEEAREDTATQVARALKKMGVKPNAKEADIIKKIPGVLKKMGLENDKLIKRDPDFIGDVLDSMNEDIDIQEEQKISLEEAVMLSVFGEAKKDEKKDKKAPETDKEDDGEGMDPVDKKALKKDYDDRAKDGDGDIDNDGDEDKNDKYLHKKRQAVTKAIAKKKGPESSKKGEPVDTNPTMDEEVERIMASFNPNRFAHYGNRAEQVMKLTAIKMAEKKHK